MDWQTERHDWPHADLSLFIAHRPHRWHVQVGGAGPDLLLLHGAGGATQSLRHLIPLLMPDHRVIAPDLPGQGFTRSGSRQRHGLAAMAEDLWALCDAQGWAPRAIVGHSAGGAIALQMALTRGARPLDHVIGLNAALGTFSGAAEWLFPAMAKLLSITPFVPQLFARLSGTPDRVADLLRGTGSQIDAQGQAYYRRLVRDPGHVEGTLQMMAQWQIGGMMRRLPQLDLPVTLIVGENDKAVPPGVSDQAAAILPDATVVRLPGLGHLAHEEAPHTVCDAIRAALANG